VKLAASIPVSFSAARQRSELLANAIIAKKVRRVIRAALILSRNQKARGGTIVPTGKSSAISISCPKRKDG
jgi:hypothetical protein